MSNRVMFDLEEVKAQIAQQKNLLLAGDEETLKQLPTGNWIGGTIPYFMGEDGGLSTREKIYVTELPDFIVNAAIKVYDEETINTVYNDAPENGFSVIIIPASSAIHLSFALNAPDYPSFATRPLIGWISGMHLDDLGKTSAKVVNGKTMEVFENSAVVMHITLPENKYAEINILNIFNQGESDVISFLEDSFSAKEAYINGKKQIFAEYVKEKGLDTRFPLVANYFGEMINISFQNVDEENKIVNFYAPVFKGIDYRQAAEVGDYVSEFTTQMPKVTEKIAFSCNCILNYLYSELEGKQTGVPGPMTFGEIAYQLLNQTLAYITINDIDSE